MNINFKKYSVLPKMIVFDLDYTLWPLWVEMYTPPFTVGKNWKIKDRTGSTAKPFQQVPMILKELKNQGIILGLASRTTAIEAAHDLVRALGWDQIFDHKQIYPGCKMTHFQYLSRKSGLTYSEMLFFDDENRNIVDLQKMGVVSILVTSGVDCLVLDQGLAQFERERSSK